MSNRERWIVYPLLFLTLGIVMRDKLVPHATGPSDQIAASVIQCQQLRADSLLCGRLVGELVQCGELQTIGRGNKPSVVLRTDPESGSGVITILTPQGIFELPPVRRGGPQPITPQTQKTPQPPAKPPAKQETSPAARQ